MIIYRAGSFEKFPETIRQLANGSHFIFVAFAGSLVTFELYNHKAMVQYVERLSFQYDRIKLHQKYHLIIHNLSSSIVTVKNKSISYFNRGGEQILLQAVRNLNDNNHKNTCVNEIKQLAADIRNLNPSKSSTHQPDCPHKLILDQPLFKTMYRDGDKLPAQEQKTVTLADL